MTPDSSQQMRAAETPLDRTHGFPLPNPPCADPSNWDPYELVYHGLPRKPDPDSDPDQFSAWMNVFGRELCFVKYSGKVMNPNRIPVDVAIPATSGPLVASAGHFGTSPNWSGASLVATSSKTFRQIYGQWQVPAIRDPAGGHATTYECATWIGLDGQRQYPDSTLPQVGTLQKLDHHHHDAHMVVEAWTQWWVANDADTRPVQILGFPIAPGDSIAAVLTVLGEHAVLCNLINQSKDPPAIVAVHVTAPPRPDARPRKDGSSPRFAVAGATAEWVLERPADINNPSVLQGFPCYDPTTFTSCLAVEGGLPGADATARNLATARLIRMYEVRCDPPSIAYISMPARAGEAAVTLTYGDSWPAPAL